MSTHTTFSQLSLISPGSKPSLRTPWDKPFETYQRTSYIIPVWTS